MRTPSSTASDFDSCRGATAWARPFASSSSDTGPHRVRLVLLLTALSSSLLFLALAAAPASAADRTYVCQITASSSPSVTECNGTGNAVPGGSFGAPSGVAVDSSGNVWVTDTSKGRISKFDSSGNFLAQAIGAGSYGGGQYIETAAWNNALNKLLVSDSGADDLWGFNGDGTYSGTRFNSGLGGGCCYIRVATDNSGGGADGDSYVSGVSAKVVRLNSAGAAHNFSGSAGYIEGNKLTGTPEGSFTGFSAAGGNVAVGPDGDIYVASAGKVSRFESSGIFVQSYTGAGAPGALGTPPAIAVDPTNGNLLVVGTGNKVYEFDEAGTYLGQIIGIPPGEAFGSIRSLAVGPEGALYVVDPGKQVVNAFGPAVILPKITYEGISDTTHTSASVQATVDPNEGGDVIACALEYGVDNKYESGSLPCLNAASEVVGTVGHPITSPAEVHAGLTGLTAETTYHYRLSAGNANPNGTAKGSDQTFTPRAVLDAATEPSIDSSPGSQTLSGSFTGEGIGTSYFFEYVPDSQYDPNAPNPYELGSTTAPPPGDPGPPSPGHQEVSAVAVVQAFTLYHYRVVLTNSFGTSYGEDRTFLSDPPALPGVSAGSATVTSPVTADLQATVNPGFGPTVVRFQYGSSVAYGSGTYPSGSIGDDGADHQVRMPVAGLSPRTTYHYRPVATNWSGTTYGTDGTFSTIGPPIVDQANVVGVSDTAADIQVAIRPGFSPTVVHLAYGQSPLLGLRTADAAIAGIDDDSHTATIQLSGLAPGATYYFSVVAVNGAGGTSGGGGQLATMSSPTTGAGNPKTKKCRKGFVKRRGKCVKKRRKHRAQRHGHRPADRGGRNA